MKRFTIYTLASFLVAAFTLSNRAIAQDAPNPNQINIKRITYAGPGCRQGSVTGNISVDARAFTLVFSEFTAEVGPGLAPGVSTTKCRVTLDIQIPNGWSYTLFETTFRGYADLDEKVNASLDTAYFFQASPSQVTRFNRNFSGPFSDNFSESHRMGMQNTVWSACGRQRALNIDTEVKLNNDRAPSNSGLFDVDSLDGQFSQIFGIRWARC